MTNSEDEAARVAAEVATVVLERLRGGATLPAPAAPPARPPEIREWMTTDEVISLLGLPGREALYQMVRRGTLPAHRLGSRLRFKRSELDQVLARRARRPLRVITRRGEDERRLREDDGRACDRLEVSGE